MNCATADGCLCSYALSNFVQHLCCKWRNIYLRNFFTFRLHLRLYCSHFGLMCHTNYAGTAAMRLGYAPKAGRIPVHMRKVFHFSFFFFLSFGFVDNPNAIYARKRNQIKNAYETNGCHLLGPYYIHVLLFLCSLFQIRVDAHRHILDNTPCVHHWSHIHTQLAATQKIKRIDSDVG